MIVPALFYRNQLVVRGESRRGSNPKLRHHQLEKCFMGLE